MCVVCPRDYNFIQCVLCVPGIITLFNVCCVSQGLCFGSNYYVGKEVLLVVPSVQQPKLFALRGHLNAHVWEGALWTIKVYCVNY